jgi:hypothetical protein
MSTDAFAQAIRDAIAGTDELPHCNIRGCPRSAVANGICEDHFVEFAHLGSNRRWLRHQGKRAQAL